MTPRGHLSGPWIPVRDNGFNHSEFGVVKPHPPPVEDTQIAVPIRVWVEPQQIHDVWSEDQAWCAAGIRHKIVMADRTIEGTKAES